MSTHAFAHNETQLPDCYRLDADLLSKVKNFDVQTNLTAFEQKAKNNSTRNLLLDFGEEQAWCCADVDDRSWAALFTARPPRAGTRWIQIWGANEQECLINLVTERYGLSPRLQALMLAAQRSKVSNVIGTPSTKERWYTPRAAQDSNDSNSSRPRKQLSDDEEKAQRLSIDGSKTLTQQIDHDEAILNNLNNHDIVSSIWHWSSVDVGKKYICLGYNSLHNVSPQHGSDRPGATRIWNWLILTEEETVILISERAPPVSGASTDDASMTRRNLLNVIHQLSKATERQPTSSVSLVPIRALMKEPENASTGAGLLLFYLFDDWLSTYGLLTMPERRYSDYLNRLRLKMMDRADINHVNDLHHLGRQLAMLKLTYQSYELLVTRVIERHKLVTRSVRQMNTPPNMTVPGDPVDGEISVSDGTETPMSSANFPAPLTRAGTNLGVGGQDITTYLSPAALDRFDRLNHRIRLYVLTEIEESIQLKDQLLGMNFNLITIKQSESIERLTRITILLAKVTILVLPITLLTSYFSMQIPGLNFTITKYWIAFTVILTISIFGVIIYGKITNTAELNMVYRPFERLLGRIVGEKIKRLITRTGQGKKRSQD